MHLQINQLCNINEWFIKLIIDLTITVDFFIFNNNSSLKNNKNNIALIVCTVRLSYVGPSARYNH